MAFGLVMGFFISMYYRGIKGLLESGAFVILTFLLLSILFVAKGMGAGDIKLLCVLASFYKKDILWIGVAAFLVGGLICIYRMGMRGIQKRTIYIPHETIAFTLPIAIGTLIVTCYRYASVLQYL